MSSKLPNKIKVLPKVNILKHLSSSDATFGLLHMVTLCSNNNWERQTDRQTHRAGNANTHLTSATVTSLLGLSLLANKGRRKR